MNSQPYIKKDSISNVLICGAGDGIGFAMVKNLLKQTDDSKVFATYRSKERSQKLFELKDEYKGRVIPVELDVCEASQFKKLSSSLLKTTHSLDLVIHSIGFLHDQEFMPEKRIEDINYNQMQKSFMINAASLALLAKSILPLIKNKQPSVFAALSARVGSISDNRSGGWYSYRASKAALNMIIKNLALEFSRSGMSCQSIAIHPGTVDSRLSKPFTSRTKYTLHTLDQAAEHILNVLFHLKEDNQDYFFDWQGKKINW